MMSLERVIKALETLGMNAQETTTEGGEWAVEAEIETKRGRFSVYAIAGGAKLCKPNGSTKYLYECSESKLRAVALQTIKANS